MNAVTEKPTGLALLRAAVPEHLISPLPKGTKAQNECPQDQKRSCRVCGGFHHPQIRHLDYVGHAAATHLLLDADERWFWEPLAFTESGLPKFDESGGLWIRLTVCSVTRLGYGNADKKPQMDSGSREKEVIGDAIRNAAMRFGLALDLWSKADLHADDDDSNGDGGATKPPPKIVEHYPADGFKKNLAAWGALIRDGKKTAEQIIAMVESKGQPMTTDQKIELASFIKTGSEL